MRAHNIVTMTTADDVTVDPFERQDAMLRFDSSHCRYLAKDADLFSGASVGETHIQVNLDRDQAVKLALDLLDAFGLVPVDLDPTPENERF